MVLKIIQPYKDPTMPWKPASGTLVGVIRKAGKDKFVDFSDNKTYIKAYYRVSYLHAFDERPIWDSVIFRLQSKDPKIIDWLDENHTLKEGESVLCQDHVMFPNSNRIYEIYAAPEGIDGGTLYTITKTNLDELLEIEHFRKLLGQYKESYLNAMETFKNPPDLFKLVTELR